MTVMRIATANGAVLTYDTDDVADLRIETPADVTSEPRTDENGTGYMHHELTGNYHLVLRIDFKHGKRAVWIDEDDDA